MMEGWYNPKDIRVDTKQNMLGFRITERTRSLGEDFVEKPIAMNLNVVPLPILKRIRCRKSPRFEVHFNGDNIDDWRVWSGRELDWEKVSDMTNRDGQLQIRKT